MRYRLFGRSGLRVSELGLGTMTFGAECWGTSEKEAGDIYGAFRDRGGNFLDTANEIYSEGRSEEILGRLMVGHRDAMVLSTKYTFQAPGGENANASGNHRKSLVRSVEASLRRLGTDYIDLLWLHAWDGVTGAEEIMRALDDLVCQGKLLHVGICNAPAWFISRCNTLAELRGWSPFVGIQVEYSLVEREVERELLPMAEALGLGTAAWSPLASGILTGKYRASGPERRRLDQIALKRASDRAVSIGDSVVRVAEKLGKSPAQVALNWLRARKGVVPLLGARTLAQLQDNLDCLDFELEPDVLRELDRVSAVRLGYPHDFLRQSRALSVMNHFG